MMMPNPKLPEDERLMAHHEAIGWLVSSIECEAPGFVNEQARLAGDSPVGQVLSDWARRLGQKGRLCRRCRRRLGESRFIARQRVCIRCKFGLTPRIGSPIDQPDDAHNRQTWSTIEPSHDTSR